MIPSENFKRSVKAFFSFLETEHGLQLADEKSRGNIFYSTEYADKEKVISISYENVEDYLQVILLKLHNGKRPEVNDSSRTIYLKDLMKTASVSATQEEFASNNKLFLYP